MRALEPRQTGFATNPTDGVRTYYEVFGPDDAERTILFLPTWSLVHSRCWKMQVPYFARRGFQVVTFDGRGNGRSDRPDRGYTTADFAADALAVLDELGLTRTIVVGYSAGGRWGSQFVAEHPERVDRLVLIAPAIRIEGGARAQLNDFLNEPPDREGWNKYNAVHWREQYSDFVEWFVGEIFQEPHSTKPFDDFVCWADGITPEHLVATTVESVTPRIAEFVQAIRCPTMIIHGDQDSVIPLDNSRGLQRTIPNCELVIIEGGGHAPQVRDPVKVNLLVHAFLNRQQRSFHAEGIAHARA